MSEPYIFCPFDEPAEVGGQLSRWSTNKLSWRNVDVSYPNADFNESLEYAKNVIERESPLRIEIRASGGANMMAYMIDIGDGKGGILARQWLPAAPSRPHETRRGEYDRGERSWFTQRESNQVAKHELLHWAGLGHTTAERSIMNPRLNFDFIGRLCDYSRRELDRRYESDEPIPPTAPTCMEFLTGLFCGE